METIYKYPLLANDLDGNDEIAIEMPRNAQPLFVRAQRNTPCLWARVNPDAPPEKRRFRVHGTGQPVPLTTGAYIGSFFLDGGALVFHVFEAVQP